MCCTSLNRVGRLASLRLLGRSLVTVLALATLALPAFAQQTAGGIIRGTVENASNGARLKNATVSVKGTGKETTSDEFGEYVITGVPAGEVTVTASYVGEPDQSATVTVADGSMVDQKFIFRRSATSKVDPNGVITLDPFEVRTERYKNAAAIAIAEERASVNIKNVVSADAFGDIPGGNVGEFVKFLPGVQVDYGAFQGASSGYSDNAATGVSVRGFGPEDTAILIDGMPVSNASPGSLTRQVGLDMLSINNASRVELIKVPTPDMPANSVGGQINLITKSAFEFDNVSYAARAFFNINSLNTDLGKTPGPVNKDTRKLTPGVEFSVSYPFSKTFGMTVTGYAAEQFDQTHRGETTYTFPTGSTPSTITNSAGPQSISNPAMTRFRVTDTARMVDTTSANIKLDWRPTPSQVLSANFQYSTYTSEEAQRRLDFRPTNAVGADWGRTYYYGTTANSTTDMTVTTIDKKGTTRSMQLKYDLSKGPWKITAAGSLSISNGRNLDRDNSHYSEIGLKLNPGQVRFDTIENGIPLGVSTYNRTANGGGIRDFTNLSNYSLDGTIAKSGEASSRNTVGVYKIDIERALDFLPFLGTNTLTFKIGARHDSEETEKWGVGTGYRDIIDPAKVNLYTVGSILDDGYVVSPGFGLPAQQWGSTYKLYELNQESQLFITPTDGADAVNNWNSYVGQQKALTEATTGAYAMLTGQFINNRLSVVAGVRQEEKTRKGHGPFVDGRWNYAKLPDGKLYRDSVTNTPVLFNNASFLSNSGLITRMKAAGVNVPDHVLGANNASLESAKLFRIPLREVNQKIRNDPTPSLSSSFSLTKKIDLKAAWSKTFKLPALEDTTQGLVSGNNAFNITESDPSPAADGTRGAISVANPGLLPESSTNWDFQVAYYTDTGGKLAVSYFTKSVTNQPQSISIYQSNSPELFAAVLTALELDPDSFPDWRLTTSTNSSTIQKTHGFEYEASQNLAFLGGWARNFQVFASYTMNSLGQPATLNPVTIESPNGTPITLIPSVKTIALRSNRFAAAGIQFATRRFSAQVRGTYKNRNEITGQRVTLPNGNFLRRFEPSTTRIDLNFAYELSKHYSVFLSGKDVFNGERRQIIRDDLGLLPAYAEAYDYKNSGVTWTFGVNGRW